MPFIEERLRGDLVADERAREEHPIRVAQNDPGWFLNRSQPFVSSD